MQHSCSECCDVLRAQQAGHGVRHGSGFQRLRVSDDGPMADLLPAIIRGLPTPVVLGHLGLVDVVARVDDLGYLVAIVSFIFDLLGLQPDERECRVQTGCASALSVCEAVQREDEPGRHHDGTGRILRQWPDVVARFVHRTGGQGLSRAVVGYAGGQARCRRGLLHQGRRGGAGSAGVA